MKYMIKLENEYEKIVIIGIAILLIMVVLSGCFGEYVHVNDLVDNPNDYLDKTTVVYAKYNAYSSTIYDGFATQYNLLIDIPESVNDSMLVHAGHYYFKGSLKKTSYITYFEVEEISTENPSDDSLFTSPTCCLVYVVIIIIVALLVIGAKFDKAKSK